MGSLANSLSYFKALPMTAVRQKEDRMGTDGVEPPKIMIEIRNLDFVQKQVKTCYRIHKHQYGEVEGRK